MKKPDHKVVERAKDLATRYLRSFKFVGLAFAMGAFAASITPSLIPRPYLVQGLLSGVSAAVGYALGVLFVWLYRFLEFRDPSAKVQKVAKIATLIVVAILLALSFRQMTFWQNSIRELMEMSPVDTAYPARVVAIALISATVLVVLGSLIKLACIRLARVLDHVVPRRVSLTISVIAVGLIVIYTGNGIVARQILDLADETSERLDKRVDHGHEQPSRTLACGSPSSLVDWPTIGRQGKNFIAGGPSREEIAEFLGREAKHPIRVYVGQRTRETIKERAQLALDELLRVGAFERSILVVATPTGTGWVDDNSVNPLEFLHAGDTAIVAIQYSFLPSWMTLLVDPRRSIVAASELFEVVYAHWKTLPKSTRPELYIHGLSLGSLGSESSVSLYDIYEDPIHGGLFSGPPFPSSQWKRCTVHRRSDSPYWLPSFRDGRLVRFRNQFSDASLDRAWGQMRFVYIQYASDPMTFFSEDLAWQEPEWLIGRRGPDVSPDFRWYPVVTFLQCAFDLSIATKVPLGYGHNYAPAQYIDGWVAVTDPPNWSPAQTARLKARFESAVVIK